jgi:hypothetical protein
MSFLSLIYGQIWQKKTFKRVFEYLNERKEIFYYLLLRL